MSTRRCVYADDDSPKAVFSTAYGYVSQPITQALRSSDEIVTEDAKVVQYFADQGPSMWRCNMEVATPIKMDLVGLYFAFIIIRLIHHLVNGVALIAAIISHASETCLSCNPQEQSCDRANMEYILTYGTYGRDTSSAV